jgi:glycogen operon protein
MINAYWEQLEFEVPPVAEFSGHDWKRWIDTSQESPDDISSWSEAVAVRNAVFPVQPRSVVVLVSRIKNKGKR